MRFVETYVKRVVVCLLAPLMLASSGDYDSARRKFDLIERDRLKPGSSISLTPRELNAWVAQTIPTVAPEGVRNPKLDLGSGTATGSALVDFVRIRRAQGKPPNWLMARLLQGEHPVTVTATIESGGGRATVNVDRVEVSGIRIQGEMLDFLIYTFVRPIYPGARVGEPFELGHRIDRLVVKPAAVAVVIGR